MMPDFYDEDGIFIPRRPPSDDPEDD